MADFKAPSLSTEFKLPNGVTLPNRLIKASLAEASAKKGYPATPRLNNMYGSWAHGNWGLIITGNVMVDSRTIGTPGDVYMRFDTAEKQLEAWRAYAAQVQAGGTPAIVQLSHPGRQSAFATRSIRAMAPSAVPLDFGPKFFDWFVSRVVFGTPKEMTKADIKTLVQQFADAAKMVHEAGFKGIQLHGAHGYLLATFLSPVANIRTDEYGGTPTNRARVVVEIIRAIREVTPPEFIVAIKVNSADHQHPNGLAECLEQIDLISKEKLDFVEISGGTYENPTMILGLDESQGPAAQQQRPGEARPTANTARREAFFLDYAKSVRERFPDLPVMLTGGFRTRSGMQDALNDNACDFIGLGRPACTDPRVPRELLLKETVPDEEAVIALPPVKMPWIFKIIGNRGLGGGVVTIVFQGYMHKLKPWEPAGKELKL